MSPIPGRNQPCYCGSGRKFKHCHGALGAVATPPQTPGVEEIGTLVALIEHNRLSEAESQAHAALAAYPDAGIVWKVLSVALVRQGKEALPALRRAAELMPDDAEAQRNLGAALHDEGQWSAALESLQRSLALEPENPDALSDAADALRALGRTRQAVPLYQRALTRAPQLIEARNNLGNAFLELGRYADAVDCYRRACALRPGDAQIVCNLGNALRQLGRLEEAEASCREAIALDPRLSIAHNNLGLVLASLGRRTEAVASYRRALELQPAYVEALNNLGNVLRDLGERRSAVPHYRQAIELDPERAESHCNLGNVLFELRQVEEAAASYRQALLLQGDYAPAHLGLAFVRRQQRRAAEAAASCQAALAINAQYVEALALLGELQADRGQFSEAEQLFWRAIEIKPDFSFAYASIATHRRLTRDDSRWLRGAEALLERPLPLGHEISLRYALGKYCDDIGQYDEAFAHYRRANELSRRCGVGYQPAGLTERIGEIMKSVDAARAVAGASDSQTPVFVIGMPRSGTSLTEQILASHPQVVGAGEVSFWNAAYDRYRDARREGRAAGELIEGLARDYLRLLTELAGAAPRVVDKMPANFMYAGLIHAAFPRARIIHMRRQPLDTCLSIYFQNFFNIGPWAHDLEDLAHYYREYLRITRHWRSVLPATALLEVPYEGLIEDQEGWTRRMLEFVGLPWDPRCLEFERTERVVITASKWQVRQKISSASVGRWRRYERYLGPLREALGEEARAGETT
jgi:tetratricopeptide (TPR) repeat protein